MTNNLIYGGIKFEFIENVDKILPYKDSLICCVCLKVPRDPVECENCVAGLFCKNCYESLKILKIKDDCTVVPKRANKFMRNILEMLLIKCEICSQSGIKYENYNSHLLECTTRHSYSLRDNLLTKIQTQNEKIKYLENEKLKKENQVNINSFFNSKKDEEIRNKLLTFNLSPGEKIELYNATIEGNINTFRKLIQDRKFPMFEEISAKGYLWTPIHYAMHYGKFEIISFILKFSESQGLSEYVMRLRSEDKRSPLLCLLKSNSLNLEDKGKLLEQICENFPNLYISQEIIQESRARKVSDKIIKKLEKHKSINNQKTMKSDLGNEFSNLTENQIRAKIMTSELSVEKKTSLYNSVINGDLNTFKHLVLDKNFSIYEEVSAKGYYWMPIHYAMHYGKVDIMFFILNYVDSSGKLNLLMNCKSNDNRCPLSCLMRSNSVDTKSKSEIFDSILTKFPKIYVSPDVIKEAKSKKLDLVLRKHHLI